MSDEEVIKNDKFGKIDVRESYIFNYFIIEILYFIFYNCNYYTIIIVTV